RCLLLGCRRAASCRTARSFASAPQRNSSSSPSSPRRKTPGAPSGASSYFLLVAPRIRLFPGFRLPVVDQAVHRLEVRAGAGQDHVGAGPPADVLVAVVPDPYHHLAQGVLAGGHPLERVALKVDGDPRHPVDG